MIGLFGGTFDPVHYGHLKPAFDVKNALGLSEVRFIPNQNPPHREPPWFSADQRQQLLALALDDYDGFVLDARELNRAGKSYMVDTLQSLRIDYPKEPMCLIMGMDALAGLKQWHQWEKILSFCHIVVTHRPGYQWDNIEGNHWLEPCLTQNIDDLNRVVNGRILLQSVVQVDLSASQIRQRLKDGLDVSNTMPKKVFQQLLSMM